MVQEIFLAKTLSLMMDSVYKTRSLKPKFNLADIIPLYIYGVGLIAIWFCYATGTSNFLLFIALFVITALTSLPEKALSPLSIFYGYYGAWYVIAPLFAERYQNVLHQTEYILAFSMVYTVFGLGVLAIRLGQYIGAQIRIPKPSRYGRTFSIRIWILLLYISSSLFVALIIGSTGGLEHWIAAPGDAFLNRAGSGVYVILSHFSSITLAALVGYYAYKNKKIMPLTIFIIWLIVTSPVHGSKFQISLLLCLLFLPWLRSLKLFSIRSIILYTAFLAIFFLGLYFRNLSWLTFNTVIPYALNYFTALSNLALSLRDFNPSLITTFFLPFVKFLTPFGLENSNMYYDMNHMLTDHYFPHAWEIRATEQWPVETDLYLNFYFLGGLPLVFLYLFIVGAIYKLASKSEQLGIWVVSILLILFMISHLRGSLYNHTDFYMYPYMIIILIVLRRYSFEFTNEKK